VTTADYLVIGSGLTGSTVARVLADHGREVLMLERRQHVGGNVHDVTHSSGIRVHSYGPHYFRCSSRRVWDFASRFAEFRPHEAVVKCRVDDRYEDWPINRKLFEQYPGWEEHRPSGMPANFEQACLQKMPRPLYETFIKPYTLRQWGVEPCQLSPQLAARIRVNAPHESILTPHHTYQGLPTGGYAQFMRSIIAGIPCLSGVDYLQHRDEFRARKAVIFTGPIDEYFGFYLGRLAYRSQRRTHRFVPNAGLLQPCAQVNFPAPGEHGPIRTIEWKHLLPEEVRRHIRGTVLTREFPYSPEDPDHYEYPFPDARNRTLYGHYRRRAEQLPNLIICGRLGEYRYFDMDQAIGRALMIAERRCACQPLQPGRIVRGSAPQAARLTPSSHLAKC
jgi:UDP-galactopyranose mutase